MDTMLGSGEDGYVFAGLLDASSAEMVSASVGSPHQQKQKRQRDREGVMMVKEERGGVAQWSVAATKDLIAIRADQEQHDSSTRRGNNNNNNNNNNNKTVWEAVASRMRTLGHRRTPEQCKCKWKNLVNRYKGKETADPENGRQCPFFDELDAVFTERARNMQRLLLLESESGPSLAKKKLKRSNADTYSDEELSNDDNDSDDESRQPKSKKKKPPPAANRSIAELLQEFLRQQQRMAAQWREAMERRAEERRLFEQEWRERMERLERERMMLDQTLREREEQRRSREESRAEKRDAILNTLLNKLIHDEF